MHSWYYSFFLTLLSLLPFWTNNTSHNDASKIAQFDSDDIDVISLNPTGL